jgi:hypothetical protein
MNAAGRGRRRHRARVRSRFGPWSGAPAGGVRRPFPSAGRSRASPGANRRREWERRGYGRRRAAGAERLPRLRLRTNRAADSARTAAPLDPCPWPTPNVSIRNPQRARPHRWPKLDGQPAPGPRHRSRRCGPTPQRSSTKHRPRRGEPAGYEQRSRRALSPGYPRCLMRSPVSVAQTGPTNYAIPIDGSDNSRSILALPRHQG